MANNPHLSERVLQKPDGTYIHLSDLVLEAAEFMSPKAFGAKDIVDYVRAFYKDTESLPPHISPYHWATTGSDPNARCTARLTKLWEQGLLVRVGTTRKIKGRNYRSYTYKLPRDITPTDTAKLLTPEERIAQLEARVDVLEKALQESRNFRGVLPSWTPDTVYGAEFGVEYPPHD